MTHDNWNGGAGFIEGRPDPQVAQLQADLAAARAVVHASYATIKALSEERDALRKVVAVADAIVAQYAQLTRKAPSGEGMTRDEQLLIQSYDAARAAVKP